jgi:hypothetical protein
MKLKNEISIADIINATIALGALAISIYIFFYQRNRDINEDNKKFTVKIEDVNTNRLTSIFPPFFGESDREASIITKKILVSNTGTSQVSFLSAISISETGNGRELLIQSNIDTTLLDFFLTERELSEEDFKNEKGKHFIKNKELLNNNRTNIKLEAGESKYFFIHFINYKWLREQKLNELEEKKSNIDYYFAEIGFKFNIGDIVVKKIYFDKTILNNFGGVGGTF